MLQKYNLAIIGLQNPQRVPWTSLQCSPLPQVVSYGSLVKPLPLVQELGNIITRVLQEGAVNQEPDPLGKGKQEG